ncbi:unnamed protein product [Porites evermanni]|uniref:SGNH hydrolase-type esterase domain-containing protein n=1 Tax=Porites evermanni TaxID=104178 RepID=A0ABN8RNG0_9CNID|nr:unnamed protein product [Porites evermanni]
MGEPRVLILGHSFIHRLNSFITDSTHLDHRFMIHEAAKFKWHGVGGRTVEKTIRCDLHVVESFAPHIVILQLGTDDLSHLDPLVAASAIEDLVGILYEEHSVRQICVCQTLIRENDAAFNARVKAVTKYLNVLLEPIPYCFFWGHRGFWNTSQRYFARDGVHLNKLWHYKYYRIFAFLGTFWRTARLVFVTIFTCPFPISLSGFYFKPSRL